MSTNYYLTPSNETNESSRLSLQHRHWTATQDGALYTAPIASSIKSVLDVGCGSGAWTVDVAWLHPQADVLGVDLSAPNRPADAPSNCYFVSANIEKEWAFATGRSPFDLIYARMLANGIHDWPAFFAKCKTYLRPGGWLEVPDVRGGGLYSATGLLEAESPALQCFKALEKTLERAGIDPDAHKLHSTHMQDAGFINVTQASFKWWLGGDYAENEKDRIIGESNLGSMITLLDGFTRDLLPLEPGMSRDKARSLFEGAKKDLLVNQKKGGFHLQLSRHVGQKPF